MAARALSRVFVGGGQFARQPALGLPLLVRLFGSVFEHADAGKAVHLAQARVVVEALERHVAQRLVERRGEQGELAVHELVGQGVRLGGNTHRDVVCLGEKRSRQQVGYGLAHACARLDGRIAAAPERLRNGAGHVDLLGARLIVVVHAPHGAVDPKLLRHTVGGGQCEWAHLPQGERVGTCRELRLGTALGTLVDQGEHRVGVGRGHLGKDGVGRSRAPWDRSWPAR